MRTFFMGDSHFETRPDPHRLRMFLSFLEDVEPGDTLVLLGDIFDFWFEYPHVVQAGHVPVLAGIENLAQRARVIMIPGNHDIWAGPLMESFGPRVHRRGVILELSGKKVMAVHGDMIAGRNRMGRFILGNRVLTWLYARIHPEIGVPLASWVSKLSRVRSRRLEEPTEAPEWIFPEIPPGIRCLITGHFHVPFVSQRGPVAVISAGDWLTNFTYLVHEDGALRLVRFGGGTLEEVVL